MTKRQIGLGAAIVILMVIGVVGASRHRPAPSAPAIESGATRENPKTPVPPPVAPAASKAPQIGGIWTRPPAKVVAKQYRRQGFAWILRQLGASERLLDRLADGDAFAVLTELKAQAHAGDPAAVNILGEIAHQQCALGRDDATLSEYEASQLTSAQALPANDHEWFRDALRADIAYDKQMMEVCKKLIDSDEVQSWVVGRAKQGDGASLWLLSSSADNMRDLQQRLRDAAAAGFAQAQFELAWDIIAGQQGAAGSGPDAVNAGDLLRQSAEELPRAEGELALCEYYGCPGVTPDIASAISHAREAAEKGDIDAMVAIGPHLPASQVAPNEVSAWTLVNAWLQQEGCAGNGFSVQWMKDTTSTLASHKISDQAHELADQYWREYAGQMMTNLGCTS